MESACAIQLPTLAERQAIVAARQAAIAQMQTLRSNIRRNQSQRSRLIEEAKKYRAANNRTEAKATQNQIDGLVAQIEADRTSLEQIETAYSGMQCWITLGGTQYCYECIIVSLSARNTTGEMVFDERLCNHQRHEQPRLCVHHSFGTCFQGTHCNYVHIAELEEGTSTMTAFWTGLSDECLASHGIRRPVAVVQRIQTLPTAADFDAVLVSADDEAMKGMDAKTRRSYKKRIAKERAAAEQELATRLRETSARVAAQQAAQAIIKVNPLDTFSCAGYTAQGLVDAGLMAEMPKNGEAWIAKVRKAHNDYFSHGVSLTTIRAAWNKADDFEEVTELKKAHLDVWGFFLKLPIDQDIRVVGSLKKLAADFPELFADYLKTGVTGDTVNVTFEQWLQSKPTHVKALELVGTRYHLFEKAVNFIAKGESDFEAFIAPKAKVATVHENHDLPEAEYLETAPATEEEEQHAVDLKTQMKAFLMAGLQDVAVSKGKKVKTVIAKKAAAQAVDDFVVNPAHAGIPMTFTCFVDQSKSFLDTATYQAVNFGPFPKAVVDKLEKVTRDIVKGLRFNLIVTTLKTIKPSRVAKKNAEANNRLADAEPTEDNPDFVAPKKVAVPVELSDNDLSWYVQLARPANTGVDRKMAAMMTRAEVNAEAKARATMITKFLVDIAEGLTKSPIVLQQGRPFTATIETLRPDNRWNVFAKGEKPCGHDFGCKCAGSHPKYDFGKMETITRKSGQERADGTVMDIVWKHHAIGEDPDGDLKKLLNKTVEPVEPVKPTKSAKSATKSKRSDEDFDVVTNFDDI